MAEQTSRNKVNIGLSSLILIFIVLCLSTFGLLSLSSARGDLELAERGAQAAKEFYEADSKGQQWLAGSDRMLQQMAGRSLEEKLELWRPSREMVMMSRPALFLQKFPWSGESPCTLIWS